MKAQAEAELGSKGSGGRTPSPPTISALVDSNDDVTAEMEISINGGGPMRDVITTAENVPSVNYANGRHTNKYNGTTVFPAVNGGSSHAQHAQNGGKVMAFNNGTTTPNGVNENGGLNLNDSGRQVRKIITAQS